MLVSATSLVAESAADPSEPHLVLWNTAAFYALRSEQVQRRRRIDHHDAEGRLVGSAVVGLDADHATTATSGSGAPFGGFDLARSGETVANVEHLVDHAMVELGAAGLTELEVRAKPDHYGANEAALSFVLANRGFSVAACDLNFFLDLRGVATVDRYVEALKPAARKGLRRSLRQDVVASQVAPDDDVAWEAAYEVLRRNRVDRGRPMRLPFTYVRAIRDAFPGRVRLLAVDTVDRLVAAALVYRVAPGHDLVQYWGDAGHDLSHSPMHLLVHAVVEHALASGADAVDVGISSEDGVANHGLIQFKRSVGCAIEPRYVWRGPLPGGGR
jgi:hypothetical protein